MEEKREDGDSEIQEHGPEHWFSKWERQCLAEAEQREPNEEEADDDQDKLWHLFQNSATAVAQLYKGSEPNFFGRAYLMSQGLSRHKLGICYQTPRTTSFWAGAAPVLANFLTSGGEICRPKLGPLYS